MFTTILEFFNQRNSGEQVLMLFVAGILLFAASIQVGRWTYYLIGT